MSPVAGSIATSAASRPGRSQALEPGGDRALGGILHRRQKGGVHLPVGRVVAAELVAELLAQELLRPAGARVVRLPVRLDLRPHAPRRVFLRGGDEALLAHLRQHDVAALERAVVVRPRRQRRRRADQPGDERRLRQRDRLRRLAEQMLRHRLDAVDAGAEIDAIQIELENLLLGELRLDQQRDAGFLQPCGRTSGAFDRNSVRASCCVSVLPPSTRPPCRMSRTTARARPIGSMPGWW